MQDAPEGAVLVLSSSGCPHLSHAGGVTRGGDSVMPYAANVPVDVAGVAVVPGDYVYVDAAGGVGIPTGSLAAVLAEAEQIVADDEESLRGLPTPLE